MGVIYHLCNLPTLILVVNSPIFISKDGTTSEASILKTCLQAEEIPAELESVSNYHGNICTVTIVTYVGRHGNIPTVTMTFVYVTHFVHANREFTAEFFLFSIGRSCCVLRN